MKNVEQIFSNYVNENVIFQNHGTHEDIFFLKKKITDNGFSDAKILTMLIILQTVFIIIMKYNVFTQLKTCTENRPRFWAGGPGRNPVSIFSTRKESQIL